MVLMGDALEKHIPTILGALMDPENVQKHYKEHDVETFSILDIYRSSESHLVLYTDQ